MSLTKPFGSNVSARFNRIIRRLRVKELARVPRMNRSATIGVAAIVVLVTAMVFASHESSARKDVKQAPRAAANTPAAESAAQPSAEGHGRRGCAEGAQLEVRVSEEGLGLDRGRRCGEPAEAE